MRYVIVYAATLAIFLALDAVWLTYVASGVFKSEVGALLRAEPNAAAAAGFYVVYAAGLVALAIMPAAEARSPGQAIWKGALLGLCAYGTFDLTNLAIIKNWTLAVSLFDMAWGTFCSALSCAIGYRLAGFARGEP